MYIWCFVVSKVSTFYQGILNNSTLSVDFSYMYMEVPWYIGLNPWLWIEGLRVWFPSMPGTFVLQQDTLSTLLLSTQVYKWVPGRMWRICCVYACSATIHSSARNAPLGVEILHCKCSLEILSSDWSNNCMLHFEHLHWMEMCASLMQLLLSPPNEVSEGTMKRAPYVCVCACVRASGLEMLKFASSLSFLGRFWFCLFYLIGLGAGFITSTQNFEIH